jgi:DNA-binding transcriptional LysR family regulator
LPGLLAGFHGKHPGIEITLWEGSSDQLLAGVRHGHLDLALVSLGPQAPAGDIAIRVLATEPVVVAVNATHPLARRKTVTVDGLREHALITLPPGTGIRAHIDAACAAAGIAVRIAFEVGDPRLAAELAGQGLGAALLPASAAHAQPVPLTILPLTSPRIEGRIALAARAEGPASPATRAFLRNADLVFSLPPNGGRT